MIYLLLLIKWLPKQIKGLRSFIRHGYITDRLHKMVIADQSHWDNLNDVSHVEGTYQKPFWPHAGTGTRAPSPAGSQSSSASSSAGTSIKPTYLRGRRTLPILPTPSKGVTVPDGCVFAPQDLIAFDEELFQKIAETIPDTDTCQDLEDACDSSGRAVLELLFKKADKISGAGGTNVETLMHNEIKNGFEPKVKSFNE